MPAPFTRLAVRLAPSQSDGDLLARFAKDRDEAAFAVLVHRHGPTVYGVCRRILGNAADADDAFQTVFLVLVNRADALAGRAALGDWLQGVAVRVALKARTAFARLRKHERRAAQRRGESATDPLPDEPSEWLDRELAELPARFREPVLLCLIQERPRAEVAAELGIPEGTLASRLDTARKRLAGRLARHRLPLAFTGLLVPVPAALASATVNRATDGAGAAIHQLALEVTTAMITKTKWAALAAVGVLTAFVGGLMLAAGPAERPAARRNAPVPEKPVPKWKQEFDKIYTLKADEVVKVIPREQQPESRHDFTRTHVAEHFKVEAEVLEREAKRRDGEISYIVVVDAKGKRLWTLEVGGLTRRNLMPMGSTEYLGVSILGFPSYLGRFHPFEVDIDTNVYDVQLMNNPDFVVRVDAPRDKLIPALDKALREQLKVEFKLELKEVEREVWVGSGKVAFAPRKWRKAGQVDVYSDEANVNKETFSHAHNLTPGFETRTVAEFMGDLRDMTQTWVVWTDGAPPKEPKVEWTRHFRKQSTVEEMKADQDPEKVLKNVAEQTGLTFKKEKRKVPVLFVRPLK